jgi:hypothetical protein
MVFAQIMVAIFAFKDTSKGCTQVNPPGADE